MAASGSSQERMIPLKEVWLHFGNFLPWFLPSKHLKMLITSLFEDVWVSNWNWGLFKYRRSYLTILCSKHRNSKVRAAKDHGKKFRSRLIASFSGSSIGGREENICASKTFKNDGQNISIKWILANKEHLYTGGIRYGSQTPVFKTRFSQGQNYDGWKECWRNF